MINIEKLRATLEYNPETGDLFRTFVSGEKSKVGTNCNGYIRTKFDGKMVYNHRLAWAHYYGEQPPEFIDHIDRDKSNNSISNLRSTTKAENQLNRSINRNNTTGFNGVTYIERIGKYKSQISINGTQKYLGVFKTAEDASKAYEAEFKKKIHQ